MNFTVLDQYNSFVENHFINKDSQQIDVLQRTYNAWNNNKKNNFFFKQKKKQGVVDRILLKQGKVYVQGVELIKREGAKIPLPLNASNLMITKLDLDDRKRKTKLEGPNEKSS